MMAESPEILHTLFRSCQTACVCVGRNSYSSIVAPIPRDSPGQFHRMTRPLQCNSIGTRVIVAGRNTFTLTSVLHGGRMGIRMNNPLPLMFPVFPSTWRERPPRLFQLTSTGNSTGMRIPPRGFFVIGSPMEPSQTSHGSLLRFCFRDNRKTPPKNFWRLLTFWAQPCRLVPGIKAAGMVNYGKATTTFPIPAARQQLCDSRHTGSRIMALSGDRLHRPSLGPPER